MPFDMTKKLLPTDYGSDFDFNSLPTFNYSGKLTEKEGGFWGTDPTKGIFDWVPFVGAASTGGIDGPGKWTDGGWVADPTQYWGIYQSGDKGSTSADSGHTAANIPYDDPNTELVKMSNGQWGYRRWNPTNADLPVQRHSPAHSSFDAIADFWMPVIGSAIVGGAGALGAGASAGAAEGAAAAGAFDAAGMGSAASLFGVGGSGAGAGAAGLGGLAEEAAALGIGDLGAGIGDVAWGANPSFSFSGSPIEEMGNFTGGGALGSDYTWGQLGQSLGYPNFSSLANGGSMSTSQALSLAKLLPNVLGMLGSNSQSNALSEVASNQAALQAQAKKMGAPYREKALAMLNDPESFFSGPVAQSNLKGVLQGLSVNGNPFGNPTSLALAGQGQMGLYNSTLANLGQMGGLSGYNAAGANQSLATQLALQQAMSQGNMWNAAGAGLNSILNPQPTLAEILAMLKGGTGGLAPSTGSFLPKFGETWFNDENTSLA